jgi:hypothetical protein
MRSEINQITKKIEKAGTPPVRLPITFYQDIPQAIPITAAWRAKNGKPAAKTTRGKKVLGTKTCGRPLTRPCKPSGTESNPTVDIEQVAAPVKS